MIEIGKDVSAGDLVSVWFSPPWEKSKDKGKKPQETEYRVRDKRDGWLRLDALDGGYSIVFTKELLDTWNGTARRAR